MLQGRQGLHQQPVCSRALPPDLIRSHECIHECTLPPQPVCTCSPELAAEGAAWLADGGTLDLTCRWGCEAGGRMPSFTAVAVLADLSCPPAQPPRAPPAARPAAARC